MSTRLVRLEPRTRRANRSTNPITTLFPIWPFFPRTRVAHRIERRRNGKFVYLSPSERGTLRRRGVEFIEPSRKDRVERRRPFPGSFAAAHARPRGCSALFLAEGASCQSPSRRRHRAFAEEPRTQYGPDASGRDDSRVPRKPDAAGRERHLRTAVLLRSAALIISLPYDRRHAELRGTDDDRDRDGLQRAARGGAGHARTHGGAAGRRRDHTARSAQVGALHAAGGGRSQHLGRQGSAPLHRDRRPVQEVGRRQLRRLLLLRTDRPDPHLPGEARSRRRRLHVADRLRRSRRRALFHADRRVRQQRGSGARRRRSHPYRHFADRSGATRRRLDPPGARRRGRHHTGLSRRPASGTAGRLAHRGRRPAGDLPAG